jgi:hypothetical protein
MSKRLRDEIPNLLQAGNFDLKRRNDFFSTHKYKHIKCAVMQPDLMSFPACESKPRLRKLALAMPQVSRISCKIRFIQLFSLFCHMPRPSFYCLTAIAEISIFAPPIRPATWTVARAGFGSGMSFLYTSFIFSTSFRSVT